MSLSKRVVTVSSADYSQFSILARAKTKTTKILEIQGVVTANTENNFLIYFYSVTLRIYFRRIV